MDEEQVLSEPVAQNQQAEPEKMLSQSEVRSIAAREKQSGIEKGRREAEQRHQQELASLRQGQSQHNSNVPREADADAMYQQIQERFNAEMAKRQQEAEMSQIANKYLSGIENAKGKYQDFDDITKDFDPTAFPQLIYLTAGLPNAGDIIYDLSKNPQKLVTLNNLAKDSPRMAQAELQKLSQSIANNQQASQEADEYNVNQPLDQIQPSRVSAGNGKKSINDLRNDPSLRG